MTSIAKDLAAVILCARRGPRQGRHCTMTEECFDVLVIGGGVVGLAVLRSATLAGWKCALVEAEPDLLTCASGSNSGIACTGVDASPGTLERALIRDSISQIRLFCQELNIPNRPCGSLVCQWPWDDDNDRATHEDDDRLEKVLAESHNAGDTHAARLQPPDVQKLEPNLAESCRGAVHIPGEVVLDPWLFPVAMAVHARENGAKIYTCFRFEPKASQWDAETETWTAVRSAIDDDSLEATIPKSLKTKSIVNATGIQADLVQADTPGVSRPHWSARPRRGQYRVFSSNKNTRIDHPIQPVPTQRTKGIFVFSSLYDQIVVGPTALDQESRTDREADPEVANELTQHAMRVLPHLKPHAESIGEYVGIRPGTECRDYQIRAFPDRHWIAAAGIRSTGLTASLGIGRHVVHLLQIMLPSSALLDKILTTPLPPVAELVRDYHLRSDGTVTILDMPYRVTHPLTRLGWDAQTDISQT